MVSGIQFPPASHVSPGSIPVPVPVASVTIGGCLTAAGLVTGAVLSTAVALGGVVVIIGPPACHVLSTQGWEGADVDNY